MLAENARVVIIDTKQQPITGEDGVAQIFLYQGHDNAFVELIDPEGEILYLAVSVVNLIRPVTAKIDAAIKVAREEKIKQGRAVKIAVPEMQPGVPRPTQRFKQ